MFFEREIESGVTNTTPAASVCPSAAREHTRPKKELTRISLVNDAQIEHDRNASRRAYSVLDHLTIMAENPKQPNKVAFEVRKARCVRGGLVRTRFPASTGIRRPHIGRWPDNLDLPKVDAREKTVKQSKSF
jgi:hypothetical protein